MTQNTDFFRAVDFGRHAKLPETSTLSAEDRAYLRNLAQALEDADRAGPDLDDDTAGIRYITIQEDLAQQVAERLRRIANA